MSETKTNSNNNSSNTNWNQVSWRSGRNQRGSGSRGRSGRDNNCRNNPITKYLFEGKMKDRCIPKFTVIETGHQATQYKKIIDTLSVLYTDKNYREIDDVIHNGINLVKVECTPQYPDSDLWTITYNVKITNLNQTITPLVNGKRQPIIRLE